MRAFELNKGSPQKRTSPKLRKVGYIAGVIG